MKLPPAEILCGEWAAAGMRWVGGGTLYVSNGGTGYYCSMVTQWIHAIVAGFLYQAGSGEMPDFAARVAGGIFTLACHCGVTPATA